MPLPQRESPAAIDPAAWRSLLELWADDSPTEMIDLIRDFLSDADEHIDSIRESLAEGDAGRLERAAHTLKSSSANMGALRASGFCRQFQDLGRKGELSEARTLLDPFLMAMDETRQALEAESIRLGSSSPV